MLSKHGAFIGSIALVLSVVAIGLGLSAYSRPPAPGETKWVIVSPTPSSTPTIISKTASPSSKAK